MANKPTSKKKTGPTTATPENRGFPIVAIGASAGGLEAFETFFKAMPFDSGIAFILIAHLDPTHASLLPELLQKRTQMKVQQVSSGMIVQPNQVFVIPPNKDLRILHGTLQLMDLVHPRGTNLPIDSFFRSLATDQGANAVGIILSGTGTDGTLGLKAIKGEVGMVMVQDEESAKYDGMPRSAIATGLADYILPPEKMPEQLIKYASHTHRQGPRIISRIEGETPNALQKIYIILRTQTNHDFSQYKINTIMRRIERRMNVHQIDDMSDYARYLQGSEREVSILFKELLIGVTNFFRDAKAFESLEEIVLPKLLEEKPDGYSIRVWVAGCSSGEEAYSLAIILQECMTRLHKSLNVQIFGTDIDEDAINTARTGLYPASIQADVSPERLKRYFTKEEDGQYRIRKSIREMLVFAPQNVIKDPPFTKLDILSCRNLLIYFGPELQKQLLPIFYYSLKATGILFLGSSESLGSASDLFSALDKKWKIFQRRLSGNAARPILEFPGAPFALERIEPDIPECIRRAEEISVLQLVETILQQSNTPPCAIIDDSCNVVYIHGRTGQFLEPAEGRISVNILEMARQGIRSALASSIRKVAIHKQEVVLRDLKIEHDSDHLLLNLTVRPILDQSIMRGLMLVVFEEVTKRSTQTTTKPAVAMARPKGKTAEDLARELQFTKENLQTTIEELETSNEELKSTNEELQSTNEELQSTNEEMETSKEELQSLNEESATVNAELQSRIEELSDTNDDMKNLLDSTNIATLFLDANLCIRRFTPRATDIIPLAGSDFGRPVRHFATSLVGIDLSQFGAQVLQDLAVIDTEVVSRNGNVYAMTVRPYRTVNNVIDGVVMTFQDVTVRKKIENELQKLAAVVQISKDAIIMLDLSGVITSWNSGAEAMYGWLQEEALGKNVRDIMPSENHKRILDLMSIGKDGKLVESLETLRVTKDGRILDVWLTVTAILDKTGKIIGIATAERDVTDQKRIQERLQKSEAQYRLLFDLANDSVVLIDPESQTFKEFNQIAHENLGYTQEEFTQLTLEDVEAAKSPIEIAQHIKRINTHGQDTFETRHRNKRGDIRSVLVKTKVISIAEKTYLLSTWRNISMDNSTDR